MFGLGDGFSCEVMGLWEGTGCRAVETGVVVLSDNVRYGSVEEVNEERGLGNSGGVGMQLEKGKQYGVGVVPDDHQLDEGKGPSVIETEDMNSTREQESDQHEELDRDDSEEISPEAEQGPTKHSLTHASQDAEVTKSSIDPQDSAVHQDIVEEPPHEGQIQTQTHGSEEEILIIDWRFMENNVFDPKERIKCDVPCRRINDISQAKKAHAVILAAEHYKPYANRSEYRALLQEERSWQRASGGAQRTMTNRTPGSTSSENTTHIAAGPHEVSYQRTVLLFSPESPGCRKFPPAECEVFTPLVLNRHRTFMPFTLAPGHVPLSAYFRPPPPKDFEHMIIYIASSCEAKGQGFRQKDLRNQMVEDLAKLVPVHSYGKCMHNMDFPPEFDDQYADRILDTGKTKKVALVSKYKFYLAIENKVDQDYVTEKFYQAFEAGAVPVYWGATNIDEYAPGPKSFIKVSNFMSVKKLAEYLKYLNENDDAYQEYFAWKKQGKITPAFAQALQYSLKNGYSSKVPRIIPDPLKPFVYRESMIEQRPTFLCRLCQTLDAKYFHRRKEEGNDYGTGSKAQHKSLGDSNTEIPAQRSSKILNAARPPSINSGGGGEEPPPRRGSIRIKEVDGRKKGQ
ncbi:Alpha-(1,3)-fucosyltransferase 11 [Quaeritorhiza haematococci]|nr:Alpha-(1,3)-fucosyltransferase 11 [Quaeritorhiza haematococci]